ncbi:PRD domain-containing protein [Aerococcaceae bacterium WS4759]|uniref:PRD domain-containing protein n=1 Tax=Fundicoccus ignavus TaxID=2664442 RepID=A0A6I2GJG2_9LACT|nr:BglG family transcription antiterminator [Fundicoccus ignavus]MRI85641.1 PRD domain-containing protein [Fundicoccus ignavus]
MYLTNREKTMIELLIEYRNGITVEELMRVLNVSKRTVYREIASIEASLAKFQLQINKPRGEGYRLIGDPFQIDALKQKIYQVSPNNFDMVQRQHALAITLLQADDAITMEALAYDFEVSIGTINADLSMIDESLEDFSLRIERQKTRGIYVQGGEKERRQILSSLLYGNINEYDFFQYLHQLSLDETAVTEDFFLKVMRPESLLLARHAILEESHNLFESVTDNQLQQIMIILALSIDRLLKGHVIDVAIGARRISTDIIKLSHQILGYIEVQLKQAINMNERHFFALQLEGLNYKAPQNIFIESFDAEISYQIKEFIRITSQQTGFDFRKDETLYVDLMAHMKAAIKRPLSLVQKIDNPLLQKILNEYQDIYKGVKVAQQEIFEDKKFSREEMAYIVIHFASSLERNPSSRNITALVLCSSGIGTSKILESRIGKYLPEINVIDVSKISQMDNIQFEQYDLILSTIFLPGFQHSYRVISPLLLDDEVKEIREYMKQSLLNDLPKSETQQTIKEVKENFEDVYHTMKIANNLLQRFDIKFVKSSGTLEETLHHILLGLEGYILEDAGKVADRVIQRYLQAPIGIPNSNIALFHSTNEWVKEPYFGIYDLDRKYPIMGMDRRSIDLQRVLLMLAPEPLDETNEMILGKISSSIIESDLNTEIYKSGSKELIYQLLSSLLVTEIRKLD